MFALTELEFPPYGLKPHVITDPLLFNAAKATELENTAITPEDILALTEVESPPPLLPPHVITLPLLFNAANAY